MDFKGQTNEQAKIMNQYHCRDSKTPSCDSPSLEYRCPGSRLIEHTQILRRALDEGRPLDQGSYLVLRELIERKSIMIPTWQKKEAETEVHRLNVAKFRYEDLVEAFVGAWWDPNLDTLRELEISLKIFNHEDQSMRERVRTMIEVREMEKRRVIDEGSQSNDHCETRKDKHDDGWWDERMGMNPSTWI